MAIHYQDPLDHTFHALGDGTRRQMLTILAERGECTASELGQPFRAAQPTISKHIRVLERAGLVSRRVDGRLHRFRLNPDSMREAQDWIARQRRFWSATLDQLGEFLDNIPDRESG
ncbi:MAG: helix-turn-helix transcriptional regulator [Planctomycetales bacterium]|nr:helix-turn-helix transcriptional regulator [Planctomycetales bacterium]